MAIKSVSSLPLNKDDRQEIRCVIGVYLLSILYTKAKRNAKEQYRWMENNFHGDDDTDTISQLDKLLKVEEPYSSLFERHEVLVSSGDAVSSQRFEYVVKEEYQRGGLRLTIGKQLTKDVLEKLTFIKTSPLLTGRALIDLAKETKKLLTMADSFAEDLVDDDGNPIKSGHTRENVIEAVLDGMYDKANPKKIIPLDDAAEEIRMQEAVKKRPESYRFKGFMAWLLFGKLAPTSRRIVFVDLKDPSGTREARGRAAQRLAEAKQKAKERSIKAGPIVGDGRGVSLNQRIAAAALEEKKAASRRMEKSNDKEMRIIATKISLDLVDRQIKRALDRGQSTDQLELEEDSLKMQLSQLSMPSPKNE